MTAMPRLITCPSNDPTTRAHRAGRGGIGLGEKRLIRDSKPLENYICGGGPAGARTRDQRIKSLIWGKTSGLVWSQNLGKSTILTHRVLT